VIRLTSRRGRRRGTLGDVIRRSVGDCSFYRLGWAIIRPSAGFLSSFPAPAGRIGTRNRPAPFPPFARRMRWPTPTGPANGGNGRRLFGHGADLRRVKARPVHLALASLFKRPSDSRSIVKPPKTLINFANQASGLRSTRGGTPRNTTLRAARVRAEAYDSPWARQQLTATGGAPKLQPSAIIR